MTRKDQQLLKAVPGVWSGLEGKTGVRRKRGTGDRRTGAGGKVRAGTVETGLLGPDSVSPRLPVCGTRERRGTSALDCNGVREA